MLEKGPIGEEAGVVKRIKTLDRLYFKKHRRAVPQLC